MQMLNATQFEDAATASSAQYLANDNVQQLRQLAPLTLDNEVDEDVEMNGPPPAPKLKPLPSPQHNIFGDVTSLPMPATAEMPMHSHSYSQFQQSGLSNQMLEQTGSFRLASSNFSSTKAVPNNLSSLQTTQEQLQASKKLTEMLAVLTDKLSQELAANTNISQSASSCQNCSRCQATSRSQYTSYDDERMMRFSSTTTPNDSQSFASHRHYNRSSFGPSTSRPNNLFYDRVNACSQSQHSNTSYSDEAKRMFHQAPVDFLFGGVSNSDQRTSSFDMAQSC